VGAGFPSTSLHPLGGRTVLQIIPELDAGGAERTAVDIAAGLAHVGARALVATRAAGSSASSRPKAASGRRFRPGPRTRSRCC
jgi:hypothetical protein